MAQVNYLQASQPANILDLEWVLFYSKEFDSQPVTEILLEKEPLCDNIRIGDPKKEMLDISNNKNAYKLDPKCTTDGSPKKMLRDTSYIQVSKSVIFNEFEMLEEAGVWQEYDEKLTDRES